MNIHVYLVISLWLVTKGFPVFYTIMKTEISADYLPV